MRKLTLTALVLLFAAGNAYAGDGPPPDFRTVPEPSTLLLLAAGLGAMAWRLRKRS